MITVTSVSARYIIQVTHTSNPESTCRGRPQRRVTDCKDLWRLESGVRAGIKVDSSVTECRTRSESVMDSWSAPTHGLTPNARDTSARLGLTGGKLPAQAAPSHLISFTAHRWVECCCHLRSGPTCDGLQRPRRCRRCHPFAKRAANLIRRHRRSQR